MKIVYPMQLGGDNAPCEVASLDAFIEKLNNLKSGTFPIGRNRLWHGGIHLSEAGGWHSSGAVRAIADGEIVAYRLACQPAKATLEPEQGQPGEAVNLYTSPSFCLIRHRYEAGEQSKNRCTFYSLYMHIACENTYSGPQAARLVVKGHNVSTYEPIPEMVDPHLFRLKRLTLQQGSQTRPVYAIDGAEVKLATPGSAPGNYLNHKDESHLYHLVSYVSDPGNLFYIAASQLQEVFPQKPVWMTPPESKPLRYTVPNNSWLRQSASTLEGSLGLPAGSEVVASTTTQMVTLSGGPTEFRKVQVFKTGSSSVQDSAGHGMAIARRGAVGWLASHRLGAALAAEPSTPVTFTESAPVVNRSDNPIPVQAGEVIGHWGEHQIAKTGANGLEIDPDSKAVHFEVFVAESDKLALEDCIENKARLTTGQGYLLLKAGQAVTTHRLTSDNHHSYHDLAEFGPLVLPLAVKESDIISHGANNFVKVRERTAAAGELAGEFVLLIGDTQLVSQHDWAKLGVKLIDGSSDPDGFLDKADTEGKEGGEFFSALYDKLVTDRDSYGTLSGDDIKAALADAELAGKLRRLFIKHESEWIQRESWPRLEQELINKPNLYKYAMQVHKNMAWISDARDILGDTKHWFIHPAGMMGLVRDILPTENTLDFETTLGIYRISKKSAEFILSWEAYMPTPYVPAGDQSSGVTVGYGYDLGQQTTSSAQEVLSNYFTANQVERLLTAVGKKGDQARAIVNGFSDIRIENDKALNMAMLLKKRYCQTVVDIYPQAINLPPDSAGAILSLVYNRGASLAPAASGDPIDRRREMREIRDDFSQGSISNIPSRLRSMKRLWRNQRGLGARREGEAQLIENELARGL